MCRLLFDDTVREEDTPASVCVEWQAAPNPSSLQAWGSARSMTRVEEFRIFGVYSEFKPLHGIPLP